MTHTDKLEKELKFIEEYIEKHEFRYCRVLKVDLKTFREKVLEDDVKKQDTGESKEPTTGDK